MSLVSPNETTPTTTSDQTRIPLPFDLFTEILPHLWDDLPILKVCSTVNHTFRTLTQSIIFATYRVVLCEHNWDRNYIGLSRFNELARDSPYILPLIRFLVVSTSYLGNGALAGSMGMMTGLWNLTVHATFVVAPASTPTPAPAVQDSSTTAATRDYPGDMIQVLIHTILPSIRYLEVEHPMAWDSLPLGFMQHCRSLTSIYSRDFNLPPSNFHGTTTNRGLGLIGIGPLSLHLELEGRPTSLEESLPEYLHCNQISINKLHLVSALPHAVDDTYPMMITHRMVHYIEKFSDSLTHLILDPLVHPHNKRTTLFPFSSLPHLVSLSLSVTVHLFSENTWKPSNFTGSLLWMARSIIKSSKSSSHLSVRSGIKEINISFQQYPSWFGKHKATFHDFDSAIMNHRMRIFPDLVRVDVSGVLSSSSTTGLGNSLEDGVDVYVEKYRTVLRRESDMLLPRLSERGLLRVSV